MSDAAAGIFEAKQRVEEEWFFRVMRRHGLSFVRDDGRLAIGHYDHNTRFFLLDGEPISKLTIEMKTPFIYSNELRWSEPDYTVTWVGTETLPDAPTTKPTEPPEQP